MKKISRIAALLGAGALLFNFAACSDGGSNGGGGGEPEDNGTTYAWNFQATDLVSVLNLRAGEGGSITASAAAKVFLDSAATYESTPAGLTMNLPEGSYFNKIDPASTVSSSVTVKASTGSIEPGKQADGTTMSELTVSVKGPFTAKMLCGANSSSDKTNRYAFIKVNGEEVAAPLKETTTIPAAGQEISYSYTGTDEVTVSFSATDIPRIYDISITTENGDATGKTAGAVLSSANFTAQTDETTANDADTLGLVGTAVSSSAEGVATAEIADGKIKITSVAAGTAVITVKDADENEATIAVTVGGTGAITISKITKYVSADTPMVKYFTEATSSVTATNTKAAVITGGNVSFAFVVDGFSVGTLAANSAQVDSKDFNGIKVPCTSTIEESSSGAKDAEISVAKDSLIGYATFTVTAVSACTITAVSATTGQTQSGNLGTAIYVNDTLVNTPAGSKVSVVDNCELSTPVALAANETATVKVAIYAVKEWAKKTQTKIACDMYFKDFCVTASAD